MQGLSQDKRRAGAPKCDFTSLHLTVFNIKKIGSWRVTRGIWCCQPSAGVLAPAPGPTALIFSLKTAPELRLGWGSEGCT